MIVKHETSAANLIRLLGVGRWVIFILVLVSFFNITSSSIHQVKDASQYLSFLSSDLQDYDPHVTDKHYYAPQNYEGILVTMTETSYDREFELISGGSFLLEFYQGTSLLAVTESEDTLRQQIIVPAAAYNEGYDRVYFTPLSGKILFLSYFSPQVPGASSVIFQEFEDRPMWTSMYEGTPSPALVDALMSHVIEATETTLTIDIESINNELGCSLLYITDSAGNVVAEFPEGSFLSAYTWDAVPLLYELEVLYQNYFTYDLLLHYQYEGAQEIRTWEINPYAKINEELYQATTIRTKDNMAEFPNLQVDGTDVRFVGEEIFIDKSLFIPVGHTFHVEAGQSIYLTNNAFIYSRSTVRFSGTEENPIYITSPDSSLYSGLVVMEATELSTLDYVTFDNLGEVQSGALMLTGAVTFFESDVIIQNCQFLNNRSEDGLNSVRGYIEVRDSLFRNTFQDAYDSDFCTGIFENVTFIESGNDAFDVSTSTFEVIDCTFLDTWDKAISTGEASTVSVTNAYVDGAQSGLAAKDSSVLTIDGAEIKNVFIGICVYQKKPEFGATQVTATNYTLYPPYDFDYIIEEQDTVIVNGVELVSSNNKKQQIIIQYMIEEIEIS